MSGQDSRQEFEQGRDDARAATLSTILEEDFIAPLAAARSALEVLRDGPELSSADRTRFVEQALRACAELERGVAHLTQTVYGEAAAVAEAVPDVARRFDARIRFLNELGVLDLDFSDYVFEDSAVVNAFYDAIEQRVAATGRQWHVLVNFRDCRVWPEAWIAFAHRGKKAMQTYAIDTVRYAAAPEMSDGETRDWDHSTYDYPSREDALAHVAAHRA